MRYCLVKKLVIACIGCFFCFAFWACKDEPPPKPQVVRKKIALKQKPATQTPSAKKPAKKSSRPTKPAKVTTAFKPKSDIAKPSVSKTPAAATASKKQTAPVKQAVTSPPPTISLRPKSDVAMPSASTQPGGVITAKSDISTSTPAAASAKDEPVPEAVSIPAATKTKPIAVKQPTDQPPRYIATGKLDPFEPLFKEQVVVPKKKKRRTPRTPLERISLSQLKLVGIILSPSGNRALVQESSGKGYIIKRGTYLGLNSGRVVEITKDTLVIEEEIENILGKVTIQKKEMKLPKPPGEF